MTEKNFNQSGVGSDLQIGKRGPHIINNEGAINFKTNEGTFTTVSGADAVAQDDFVTLRQLNAATVNSGGTSGDAATITIGFPTDGSLNGGAVSITNNSTVTDVIDQLNTVLGKLVPTRPPTWPNSAFTLTGTTPFELAQGVVVDRTGGAIPVAGATVPTVFAPTISSNVVGGIGDSGSGPGDTGTLTAMVNGINVGSKDLSSGSDTGTYGKLVITGDVSYPAATPGFWQVVNAQITNASLASGYNKLQITHTGANNTTTQYVLYDNVLSGVANISSPVVSSSGTTSMSSGIPHYVNGTSIAVAGIINNAAGLSYRKTGMLSLQGVADTTDHVTIAGTTSYDAGTNGIPNPLTVGASNLSFTGALISLSDVHSCGRIQARAQNPNGGSYTDIATKILVKGSDTTARIQENNILVYSDLGTSPVSSNATRVSTVDGDTPNWTFTGAVSDWNNSSIAGFDATVVGGILKHDITNYSTGYIPVGPNYSSHNASQYAVFMFRRMPISKFDIQITGTVAGVWVKLPGITNTTYDSTNGWRDMTIAYGSGTGCSLAGSIPINTSISSKRFTCTFGTDSSALSTNNIILVRIKLTSGQKITSLQFRGASN